METTVEKTKFVWSIILCVLSLAPIVFAICMLVELLSPLSISETLKDIAMKGIASVFIIIISFLVGFGLVCGAHFLYASYSKARGKKSVAGKIYYWLTIIFSVPFFIVVAVIGLVLLIISKLKKGMDTWVNNPSSSSGVGSDRSDTYTINVGGYNRDIKWDQYTRTYRDSSGNHYETKDGGKTFSKKN